MNNNNMIIDHIPGEIGGDDPPNNDKTFRLIRAQGVGSQYIPCIAERKPFNDKHKVKVITPGFVIIALLYMVVVFAAGLP